MKFEKDEKGKFIKGNRGGGRTGTAQVTDYRMIVRKRMGPLEFGQLVDKAIEQANNGCWRSREWITKFLIDERQQLEVSYNAEQLEREQREKRLEEIHKIASGMTEEELDKYEELLAKAEEMKETALAKYEDTQDNLVA